MLTSVVIHNYRSCENVSIEDIDNLLVLIGKNGAGKTNILKAINWAANIQTNKEGEVPGMYGEDWVGEVTLNFSLDGLNFSYYKKRNRIRNETEAAEDPIKPWFEERVTVDGLEVVNRKNNTLKSSFDDNDIRKESEINISEYTSCLLVMQSLFSVDHFLRSLSEKLIAYFQSVNYYPLYDLDIPNFNARFILDTDYKEWVLSGFRSKGGNSNPVYKILHLHKTNRDVFEELKSLLGENGLGIVNNIFIQEIPFNRPQEDGSEKNNTLYLTHFTPAGFSDANYGYSDLSFGTKRILTLITSMLFDHSSISLIEQPEDGIHSGLLDKLVPLLREYSTADNAQILISSHSSSLLNRTSANEVVLVEMDGGHTLARKLSSVELLAAENYLNNDGSFSEFLESI